MDLYMRSNVIVCDAPFAFSDKLAMSKVKRGSAAQYKNTMSIEELKKLDVANLSAPDALLAFWVPSSLIKEGIEVIESWGFRLVQTWVWVKTKNESLEELKKALRKKSKKSQISITEINDIIDNFNLNSVLTMKMGRTFRQTHEIVLIGVKGKINSKIVNRSQRSVDLSPLVSRNGVQHSAKPEILQERLEMLFGENIQNPVELFARRVRPGWSAIGNEVEPPEDITVGIARLIKENK